MERSRVVKSRTFKTDVRIPKNWTKECVCSIPARRGRCTWPWASAGPWSLSPHGCRTPPLCNSERKLGLAHCQLIGGDRLLINVPCSRWSLLPSRLFDCILSTFDFTYLNYRTQNYRI